MSEFINNISQFIQSQFPAHYREQIGVELTESQRAVIIDFVEAYYEWVESENDETFIRNRQMLENRDIDTTLDEFIDYFRKTFLRDITFESATDDRYVIKHIMDLYRSKGSPAAVKLLIALIFNETSEVYVPGKDILRASDSNWFEPSYIEVYTNDITKTFLNQRIFGSKSGTSAFVEGIVTKRVKGRLIDVIYLSDNDGDFVRGDRVSVDGVMATAPEVVGSLSGVELDVNSVGGFSRGDIVDIISEFGVQGQAVVRSILTQQNAIDFTLIDGGFGYTTDDNTKTYISDLMVLLDNSNTTFSEDDIIRQSIETVYLDANSSLSVETGENISGFSGNTEVANGNVLETGVEVVNDIFTDYIKIQVENGTFISNQTLTLESNTQFIIGEEILSQSSVELDISSSNGTFSVGETVYTVTYLEDANTVVDEYVFGEVVSANTDSVVLEYAYGDFVVGRTLTGRTSEATATINGVNVTQDSISSTVVSQSDNSTIEVKLGDVGGYDANTRIYGTASKIQGEVSGIEVSGIDSIYSSNTEALIQTTLTSNNNFEGILVGQNTICFGVANTTNNEFVFIEGISKLRNQSNTELIVDNISPGSGADAKVGPVLEYPEVIEVSDRIINIENVYGIPFSQVKINGENSGLGIVDSIDVIDGGTGYSNTSTVTFSGGGYSNQTNVLSAQGNVVTDANGVITTINITDSGSSYFQEPEIQISDGSGANVSINMTFGYALDDDLFLDETSLISDIITASPITIGTITSLTGVKRGTEYTRAPFVRFVTPKVKVLNIKDQILTYTLTSGSFAVGELITQANTGGRGSIQSKVGSNLKVRTATIGGYFEANSEEIVGQTSGARAIVNVAAFDEDERVMGTNADILASLINADGVINEIEISSSGYGYVSGEPIEIIKGFETITGTAVVETQGKDYGYWKSQTSHISSDKYIHDNDYYQEYSYDIQSGVNLIEYRDLILNILHMSGTKLFGSVIKTTEKTQPVTLESSVTQE